MRDTSFQICLDFVDHQQDPMSNNPFSEMPMLVSGRVCNSDLPHLVPKDVAGVGKNISKLACDWLHTLSYIPIK